MIMSITAAENTGDIIELAPTVCTCRDLCTIKAAGFHTTTDKR
jgi:hypothetical protein